MKRLPKIFSVISGLLLMFNNVALLSHTMNAVTSTYIVDRLTDNNVAGGGEGSGVTGDLRYAITHAKSGENISFKVTGTINLAGALPTLTRNIAIEGRGANQLILDGAGGSVFSVSNGTSIVISGLAITGGSGNGGGIFNAGTLTLNHCTISGNRAGDPTNGGGTGAGIWNYTSGNLTLNNSTVSGNAVYGNSSYNPSRGGGIANYGTLTINNSTISGNSASEGTGGGISNTLATSILTLRNTTVGGNSVSGTVGKGGGIHNLGTLNTVNTIIGGNTGSQNPDVSGAINSSGHNLIGNTNGGTGFRADLGDVLNVSPKLNTLQSNGGSTKTMALLSGSPGINAGSDTVCTAAPINKLDQRGVTRPQGTHCDIGAYEMGGGSIRVTIGGNSVDNMNLPPSTEVRKNYPGIDSGPVRVESTNGVPIVASLRDLWWNGSTYTSSIQLMGLPQNLLSDTYFLPVYNNVSLSDQLRFGNVGTNSTTVTVTIGGVVRGTYNLLPNQRQKVSYPGLDSGPVIVRSSNGVPIIVSIRDSWINNGVTSSFSQLMGLPQILLSDTYLFPTYNNVSLSDQLRFGNVGKSPTTVTVTIGGVIQGTYYLQPNQLAKASFPGLDSGPVMIRSSSGVPIIASLRESWINNGVTTSFFQMMGLPQSQLSDKYVFPTYDNVTLSGQLRFSNVGNANTTVTVTIAGLVMGNYPLVPNQRQKVSYPGLNSGPVIIQSSNGVPIIAALRDAWSVNGTTTSFSQQMGLPGGQLSNLYIFPSYNNATYDNQLRIGVP